MEYGSWGTEEQPYPSYGEIWNYYSRMDESKESDGPDLDRIGLFKEMSYHNEYVPLTISFNDASKKGKQMMTNSTKSKAGNQDGYFQDGFQRAFDGDVHLDRIRLNRLYRLEKAKLNLTPCFKYTSATKKPSGKGSNYGTFTEYDRKLEHFSSKGVDRGKYEPPKKNFYVNPPKKGTGYGYPDVTIGKLPPYFLETEYEELKNAPTEPKKPQPRSFEPYRAGIFQQEFFDPNPYGTDLEYLSPEESEEKEDKEKDTKVPFFPSSPAKKDGGMKGGCLCPFPEHTTDPYPKIDLVPRGVKRYINAQNQMFRPVPGVRPYPVKSVVNKNVDKRINSTNFASFKGDPLWKK